VLIKDEICTLVNIVTTSQTHADLFPHSCTTQGFATFNAIQTKEKSYYD
jgi:hypothetical protein